MIRLLFVLCMVSCVPFSMSAQNAGSLGSGSKINCEDDCGVPPGLCHLQKAFYLLHGRDYSAAECVRKEFKSYDSMKSTPRILLGIAELDKAVEASTGIDLPKIVLKDEQAAARIQLAYSYADEGNAAAADLSFKEAGEFYISLFNTEKGSVTSINSIPRIAAGLIRCGQLRDALRVLQELHPQNPDRVYLTAEALFGSGDRQRAAVTYEQWIKLDCKSEVTMILNDQYRTRWNLVVVSKPANLSPCQLLPKELRSRFEGLREQFGHPNNIPKEGYPAVVWPVSH